MQRSRTKRSSIAPGISTRGPTISNAPATKLVSLQTSIGSASGFLGAGDDSTAIVY